MRLWTIQPIKILNLIETTGTYYCNEKFLKEEMFIDAYNWLIKQMSIKIGNPPSNIKYPVWAWYKRNGKNKKPDLRESGYAKRGTKLACIELEVPDNMVVLSDFNNWHYVLNKSYCDKSNNEQEWEKIQNWFDNLSVNERKKHMVSSWDNIFDIEYFENEWRTNGLYIQATFWELKKEYVKTIQIFTAK